MNWWVFVKCEPKSSQLKEPKTSTTSVCVHLIYLIHEFHNLSWIAEINLLFHGTLIYWDAPVHCTFQCVHFKKHCSLLLSKLEYIDFNYILNVINQGNIFFFSSKPNVHILKRTVYLMPYNETWEYFDLVFTTNLISGISKTTTTTTKKKKTLTSGGWRSLHVLPHKKTISLPNSIYPFSGLKTLSFHTFVVFLAFLKLDKYHNDPVLHEGFFSTLLVCNNLTTVNNEKVSVWVELLV